MHLWCQDRTIFRPAVKRLVQSSQSEQAKALPAGMLSSKPSNSVRYLAAAHKALIVTEETPEDHAAFITSRDFFFLSTVNDRGEPTVSNRGGAPGFVRVIDSKT